MSEQQDEKQEDDLQPYVPCVIADVYAYLFSVMSYGLQDSS